MSPSRTTWSRPTRWPSNRAEGPQTRAPLNDAAEVVVDRVGDVGDRRTRVQRDRLVVDAGRRCAAGRG